MSAWQGAGTIRWRHHLKYKVTNKMTYLIVNLHSAGSIQFCRILPRLFSLFPETCWTSTFVWSPQTFSLGSFLVSPIHPFRFHSWIWIAVFTRWLILNLLFNITRKSKWHDFKSWVLEKWEYNFKTYFIFCSRAALWLFVSAFSLLTLSTCKTSCQWMIDFWKGKPVTRCLSAYYHSYHTMLWEHWQLHQYRFS